MDRRLRSILLSALALSSGVGVVSYCNALLSLDAFARFRTKPGEVQDPISIRLNDIDVRHFAGSKLVTFAHVRELNIARNQNFYELFGVTRGRYAGSSEPFNFEASHAAWRQGNRTLEGFQDVHVQNARYDLHGQGFTYQPDRRLLTVAGRVTGTYEGSKITKAENVIYREATSELDTGPVEMTLQSTDDQDKATHWQIKTGPTSAHGDEILIKDLRATDGVIIVRAREAIRNKKTDVITCFGPVKYWSPKADAICDHAVIDRKAKRAILTGRVTMVVKPKDHEVTDEKVEVVPFKPLTPDAVSKDAPPTPSFEHLEPKLTMDRKDGEAKANVLNGVETAPGAQKKSPVNLPLSKNDSSSQVIAETAERQKELDDELRSNESARKYPATIYADKIDYFYGKGNRHGIATGSKEAGFPQAQQELPGKRWRRVWADHAIYDGEKETLTLLPPKNEMTVRVKTSVGDDFRTESYKVSTQEGNDDSDTGNSEGVFVSEDEESNQAVRKAGEKDKPTKPPEKPNPN